MRDLKRTPLRHQMLARIAAGGVERARFGEATWEIPSGVNATRGHQQRAVSDVVGAGFARIDHSDQPIGGPVVLNPAGQRALADWNERFGRPALEQAGALPVGVEDKP